MNRNDGRPRTIDPAWAWARYDPDERHPWTRRGAGHLYRRAGFGATWEELERAVADGPQRTVDRLLEPEGDLEGFAARFDEDEVAAVRSGPSDGVRSWWLRRMIESPDPLREKLTLFWHGFFAADASRVKEARTMRQHVALLRRHSLGSFRVLLEEVSRDPAMLLTLGADQNRRARPQDGLARALLGAFTVGPDHFGEEDVREASRAFTGVFVRREQFHFVPREHDEGEKRILGKTGAFTGEEAVAIALEHRATPRNLVRKLYRFFVSEVEEPSPELVAPLAESFADKYDTAQLVETILRSNLFFSAEVYRRRIKSPVELAVGIVRSLEGMVSTSRLARDLARLGQSLLHPPTGAGWVGGPWWIDRVRLGRRQELTLALLNGGGGYGRKLDPEALAARIGYHGSAGELLRALLLQDDTPNEQLTVSSLATLPELQLA